MPGKLIPTLCTEQECLRDVRQPLGEPVQLVLRQTTPAFGAGGETQTDSPAHDLGLWQVRAVPQFVQAALGLMQVRRARDRRGQAPSDGQQE